MHPSAAASGRSVTRLGSRKKKVETEEKVEEVIFSVESHSGKELRHFKFICVSFMAQLLASNSFIGKVRRDTAAHTARQR